jgi:hypothetical protein
VKLDKIDAASHGKHAEEKEAAQETAEHLARITQLQRKLYADHNHSLLIVLQGIDGGHRWHLLACHQCHGLPGGVNVRGFKEPTPGARPQARRQGDLEAALCSPASRSVIRMELNPLHFNLVNNQRGRGPLAR